MRRFYEFLGGRKEANGYLGTLLITGAAFLLDASFVEYAVSVGTFLGITSATVAWEDRAKGDQG